MKICIVAEHASYKFGGEAVLPLHYFAGLRARGIDTWLVVHSRTRAELEAAFPGSDGRILYIEDAWFHKLLFRLSFFLPRRISESTIGLLSQLITQFLARKLVRELVARNSIDLVHQPIPVSPRFPSVMVNLGAPIVIGPMNGGMEYPPAFRRDESLLTRLAVSLGRRFSDAANTIFSGKKRAQVLLVANRRTQDALPSPVRGKIIRFPENGVDLATFGASVLAESETSTTETMSKFLFVGRLVDWKHVDIAIEAISQIPDASLEIIGDGPMRTAWEDLARRLGIEHQVSFSGWLSQETCAAKLQTALGLVLPSIYESGGAVALEAMAAGVPVIATKWGGPEEYLSGGVGILVEPESRHHLVEGFRRAMCDLMEQPHLARKLGALGRERIRADFDWGKKIEHITKIYAQALGHPQPEEQATCKAT